jgi:DNA-binding NtrC family response regulator
MEGDQMRGQRILVVDDESSLRTTLLRALNRNNYQVATAQNASEALSLASSGQGFDLALVDLRLPDMDGLELMDKLKSQSPEIEVIILTGFGTIQTAIDATKKGAYHFLTKPFNLDELYLIVDKALENKSLKKENTILKTQLHHKYKFDNIVGQSPELTKILELIDRVSDSDSTILVTGESGTGKEVVARAIHYNSSRANKTLIPVNCGAIPNELLESELFGHVKGAFTGATSNRVGRFELANGGTIFLDEIAEMSTTLQVKLLRVLQERTFEPVGSAKSVEVDVRIIAATNVELERAVAEGRFREDLYYRLNVIPIHIPALRERTSDIPLLIHHFIEKFNVSKKRSLTGITPEAVEILSSYMWPGNIRELENLIERIAIIKGSGRIELLDLPDRYRVAVEPMQQQEAVLIPTSGIDFNSAVDAYENALILKALENTNWNRNRAAQLLRLNRTTLVEKIKKKGLNPPESSI